MSLNGSGQAYEATALVGNQEISDNKETDALYQDDDIASIKSRKSSLIDNQEVAASGEKLDKINARVDIGASTLLQFGTVTTATKVYLNWHVKGEKENGLFMIERSTNGQDYEIIGAKKGIGIPIESKVLYCWVDDEALVEDCWYRLFKMYEDGRFYYSEVASTSESNPILPNY